MRNGQRWITAALILSSVTLAACAKSSDFNSEAATDQGAARVEPIKGTDVARIVLSPVAARRLGIRTAAAGTVAGRHGTTWRTIPYAALLYDPQGRPFTYVSPARLTYVRRPVEVASIGPHLVLLRRGPAPGTRVVTVGSAELLGTEYGVEE